MKLLLPILLLTTFATADELDIDMGKDHTGFFIGGRLGQMTNEFELTGAEFGETKHDSGLIGVYGGYNFTQWFGLEMDLMLATSANEEAFYLTDSAAFAALKIQPKFTYQINDWLGLFAKAGLYRAAYVADMTEDYAYTNYYSITTTERFIWSGVGYTAGVGLQFSVTEGLNLRGTYDYSTAKIKDSSHYDSSGYPESIDIVVNELSLGLHYQF